MLGEVQNKLKTAYKCICNSDNPHSYLQLALVRDEICNIRDHGRLNEITRHTLQGQVDEILKIKEPLKRGLEDIFHYNDSPCPKLTIILGAPGIIYLILNKISLAVKKSEANQKQYVIQKQGYKSPKHFILGKDKRLNLLAINNIL